MPAQLFQQHLNQQIGPSDVLGDWGEPRHVVTEAGPVEAPITEPFHEFGKLFTPGLIPLAVPSKRRRVDTNLAFAFTRVTVRAHRFSSVFALYEGVPKAMDHHS